MTKVAEEVVVQVSAQTSELKAGMDGAAAAVKSANAGMIESTEAAAVGMKGGFLGIGAAAQEMGLKVQESAAHVKESIEGMRMSTAAMAEFVMVALGVEMVLEGFKKFAEAGVEAHHFAEQTGMTVEQVSRLKFAAESTHVSAEALQGGMAKLAKTMTAAHEGNAKASASLEHFGITAKDLHNPLFNTQEALLKIADKTKSVGDGFLKTGDAQKVMGRGAAALIPLLNEGSAGIAEFGRKSDELGATITDKVQGAMDSTAQSMLDLHLVMKGVANTIMTAAAPAFASLVEAIADSMREGGALRFVIDGIAASIDATAATFRALDAVAQPTLENISKLFRAAGGDGETLGHIVGFLSEVVFNQLIQEVQLLAIAFNTALAGAQIVMEHIINLVVQTTTRVMQLGAVVSDVMSGSFMKIKGDWDAGNAAMAAGSRAHAAALKGIYGDLAATIARTLSPQAAKGAHASHEGHAGTGNADTSDAKGAKAKKEKAPKAEKDHFAELKSQLEAMEDAEKVSDDKRLGYELAFWQSKLAGAKAGTAQYRQIQHEILTLEKQIAKQKEEILKVQEAGALAHEKALFAQKKAGVEAQLALGQLSKQQELTALAAFEQQAYEIESKGLESYMATLTEGTAAYAAALNQRQALTDAHNAAIQASNAKMAEAQSSSIKAALQPVTSAIQQSVNGMIAGTTTMKQAIGNVLKSILGEFVASAAKMASTWIANELVKTRASIAGIMQRQTAERTAAVKSKAIDAATGKSQITSAAATGAAKAYQAIVGIPYVGPILAPIAAGVAFLGIEAFGSRLGSAKGGWGQVPADQIASIHKDEMVLPAELAQGVRDMTRNGGGGVGTTVNVHALDMRSLADAMRRNPSALAGAVQYAGRMGHLRSYS